MTKISPKRGMIPPYSLWFIVFISRFVVSLTYAQSVSAGKISTDLVFAIIIAGAVTLLVSLPAYFCVKCSKNPLDNNYLKWLYSAFFVCFASLNISRFSYFASTRMNNNISSAVFVVLVSAAVAYCASMGIEALGRFSLFSGILILIAVLSVTSFNIKNFHFINFYPIVRNETNNLLYSTAVFTSNSVEPVLLLFLGKKTNGKIEKAYFLGMTAAFVSIALLISFCVGVMGSGADLQSYPIFTLFQMASVGSMSRLDIVHASFWILTLVLKGAVLISAAADSIGAKNYRRNTALLTVISVAISLGVPYIFQHFSFEKEKPFCMIAFALFAAVFPLVYLFFGRRCDDAKSN